MFKFIKKLFGSASEQSDQDLLNNYVEAGAIFGSAVSQLYMGECIGFDKLFRKWEKLEKEYINRGYRAISLDSFVEHGGYGEEIDHLYLVKRAPDEKPFYHAKIYREHFLGQVPPALDLEKMMEDGKPQYGNFYVPSTESFQEE